MGGQAYNGPRGQHFYVLPAEIKIIDDPKHPLYDPRIKMPIDEPFIASIRRGIRTPVRVRKEGDEIVCVFGRRRVRAARIVNERLQAQGAKDAELVRVPCMFAKDDDAEAFRNSIEENAQRVDNDVLTKAADANRMHERGFSDQEVADAFGVTLVTLKSWNALLDCSKPVKEAVAAGRIRLSDVKDIAGLPVAEQAKKVEEIAVAKPTRATRKAAGQKIKKGVTPMARLKMLHGKMEELPEHVALLVKWLMGEIPREKLLGGMVSLTGVVK